MMAQSEDDIVLAAEFALGTLAADERAQAETRMAVDADFRRAVVAWEGQLGTLNQMVGSIEPRPEVWERIREAVGHARPQAPLKLPVDERAAVSAPPPQPHSPAPSNVIAFESRVGPWRSIALSASAIAAALIALLAIQTYRPELVPWMPKAAQPAKQVAQVAPPAPVIAPPAAQYVALLQKDNNPPGYIMTVNARTKSFTVRRLGDAPESGKSLELWIVSDKLQRPRSLGLIGASEFTTRAVLASYDTETVNKATYAVTLEPEGGAPNGVATGPIVYAGKLIEAVPAPSAAPVQRP
jgi:anti-sigma-K factor RskA